MAVQFPIAAADVESVARCYCCQASARFIDVAEVAVAGTTFLTTSVCAACGLVVRRRRPGQGWFERMWKLRAEWQRDRGGTPFNSTIEEQRYARYAFTSSLLLRYGGRGELIDIGCGPATGLRAFAEAGFSATGLEPDPTRARFANVPGISIIEQTIEEYAPTAQARFDVVTCQHSLEHFHDPRLVLSHVAALAKLDAIVFVEVPDFRHSVRDWQDALYLAHHTNFTVDTLQYLAAQLGLECIGREYPSDGEGESHLALVFRKRGAAVPFQHEVAPGFVEQVKAAYQTGVLGPPPEGPLRFVVPCINDLSLTLKGDPTMVRATVRENQANRIARLDPATGQFEVAAA